MKYLITTEELATVLGVKTQTIRNLRSTHPERLPHAYRCNQMHRIFFRTDEVEQFLQSRVNNTQQQKK